MSRKRERYVSDDARDGNPADRRGASSITIRPLLARASTRWYTHERYTYVGAKRSRSKTGRPESNPRRENRNARVPLNVDRQSMCVTSGVPMRNAHPHSSFPVIGTESTRPEPGSGDSHGRSRDPDGESTAGKPGAREDRGRNMNGRPYPVARNRRAGHYPGPRDCRYGSSAHSYGGPKPGERSDDALPRPIDVFLHRSNSLSCRLPPHSESTARTDRATR